MLSYVVAQRRPEIGVRVALGARRLDVLGLIMSEAGRLVLVGVVAGLGIVAVGRPQRGVAVVRHQAERPAAPGIGVRAARNHRGHGEFLPARRATRVDPAQLLREDETKENKYEVRLS
jgi:hypothetical protein